MGEVVTMRTTALSHPILRGLASGTKLTGAWFEETLVPDEKAGAEVLAVNDEGVPCVTASSHGDWTAVRRCAHTATCGSRAEAGAAGCPGPLARVGRRRSA